MRAVAFVAIMAARDTSAQDRPSPSLDLSAGWVGFADDGIVSEGMAGGALRWYVSRRVSVGPEAVFIAGSDHSHQVLTGNVTFDLLGGPARSVMPFVTVGGGLFHTREQFFGQDFSSSEGAFTLGGGMRAAAGDRVTVGMDVRIGWELHARVNGVVGIRLGR